MSGLNIFVPITKVDAAKRLVYGVIAAETPDKANEVFDYASSKPAFEAWSGEIAKNTAGASVGNLRAMHGKVAAGKLTSIAFDDAGKKIEACAKVVDDDEWKKVEEGVYSGFSIGGKYAKRWKDENDATLHRYTAEPHEVSLVDNPCIPGATFTMVKADGIQAEVPFKAPGATEQPEPTEPTEEADATEHPLNEIHDHPMVAQKWTTADGQTFAKKRPALLHQIDLDKAAIAKPLTDAIAGLSDAVTKSETPKPIEGEEPAQEVVKAAPKPDLAKGLYNVARLADLLDMLGWLIEDTASEALWEGDASPVPEQLRAGLKVLADAIVAMTEEEVAELLAGPAAKATGKKSMDWQKKHDKTVAKGAKCTADKAAPADDLAKVSGERDALQKAVDDALPMINDLKARVEKMEKQPAPMPNFRVVDKAADGGGAPQGDLIDQLAKLTPDEQSMLLTKVAQRTPVKIA